MDIRRIEFLRATQVDNRWNTSDTASILLGMRGITSDASSRLSAVMSFPLSPPSRLKHRPANALQCRDCGERFRDLQHANAHLDEHPDGIDLRKEYMNIFTMLSSDAHYANH